MAPRALPLERNGTTYAFSHGRLSGTVWWALLKSTGLWVRSASLWGDVFAA